LSGCSTLEAYSLGSRRCGRSGADSQLSTRALPFTGYLDSQHTLQGSSLKQFPYRGRNGDLEGTRELVMASLPYIIVYGIEAQMIHIFRVIHAAQDWPQETH
jgi:ParE toxin of type II toxin-antitoxin system, parDE